MTYPLPRTSALAMSAGMAQSLEWISNTYNVPARGGQRVVIDGRAGVIVGADGPHLMVKFAGDKYTSYAHPTWRVEYIDG